MPIRPLLLVAALAGGDYLLWTWSSDGDSTTVALISGLALAPLILALVWLVSLGFARVVIVRASRSSAASPADARSGRRGRLARLTLVTRGGGAQSAPAAQASEDAEWTMRTPERQKTTSEKIAA